jgi:hypothetical protein
MLKLAKYSLRPIICALGKFKFFPTITASVGVCVSLDAQQISNPYIFVGSIYSLKKIELQFWIKVMERRA